MDVEIRVDRARCIGSGQCVHWAPGVFEQDDDAISVVVNPRGEPEARIVRAVTSCPVQAITLHVGDATITAEGLRDWVQGIHADDPLVAALDQLSGDHHDLRAALSDEGGHAAAGVGALVTAHLRHEEAVYTTIAALIGPTVVDAFERDHVEIERALHDLAAHATDPAGRARAQQALATAVEAHIRLEEMVLFPLALAALARGATTSLASP